MRISKLKVTNHRAIPDLDIDVRRHLVLVGPNECGKTSLLVLLDAALSGSQAHLYSILHPETFRDASSPLEATIVFSDFSPDDEAAFADHILVPNDDDAPSSLTLRLTAQIEPGTDEIVLEREFRKPGLRVRARPDELKLIGWAYLPANRSPDRELGPNRRSAIRVLLAGLELGGSEEDIRKAVEELHSVIDSADALGTLRTEIASALGELLPREISEDDVLLRLPNADEVDPLGDVNVHLQDPEGQNRPLRQQSDGVRAMSTVAIQLLTRSAASIIAVDEPEIHLHPRAQAQLAQRLNDSDGQRVIATHAPAILERFSPTDVVAFSADRSPRQLAVDSFVKDPKLSQHWWTTAALEPVTSRAAILVEGIADRALIEAVARARGSDLDRLGISVVEVDGAGNFSAAIRLYGPDGFGVPLAGLVDKAEAGLVAKAFRIEKASLNGERFQIARPDLEGECIKCLGVRRHLELLVASGYFSEHKILNRLKTSDISSITPKDYREWCGRKSNKVRVAIALAAAMTEPAAQSLTRLATVVDDAVKATRRG